MVYVKIVLQLVLFDLSLVCSVIVFLARSLHRCCLSLLAADSLYSQQAFRYARSVRLVLETTACLGEPDRGTLEYGTGGEVYRGHPF